MLPDLAQLLDAPAWLLELIGISIRITIVLGAAGLAARVLHRAPSQARHLLWTLALTGVLLLPLAGWLAPTWTLRVLPPATPLLDDRRLAHSPSPSPREGELADARWTSQEPQGAPRGDEPGERRLAPAPSPPLTLDRWLLALWLTGIALVLLRALVDRAQTWYLDDRASEVEGERAVVFALQVERLGIRRAVRLVEVDDAALPMTWGILRPTVALPVSSRWWTGARLEAVLLHELAHVRRHDAFTQLLAQIVCAVYWVHPFVWWAARRMRVLREYACDDEVLSHGVRPSSYAEELIGIVKGLRVEPPQSGATLAMAHRSELKERIVALLDPHVPHAPLGRRRQLTLGAAVLGLIFTLAVVRPAVAEPPPADLPLDAAAVPPAPPAPTTPPSAVAAPRPPTPPRPPAAVSATHEESCRDDATADGDREARRQLDALARRPAAGQELAEALVELADDEELELERTRRLYLAQVARVPDEPARAEALSALLRGAPTTAETARGILALAERFTADGPREEVLSMMLQIRERELVRGSMAMGYLAVAAGLEDPATLAGALRDLLHPAEVRGEAVERALALTERLASPALREEVLREVTDHQRITPTVEASYRKLLADFSGEAKAEALERLTEAKATPRASRHRRTWVWRWSAPGASEGGRQLARQLDSFKTEEARPREEEARLREQAAQLRAQARQLDARIKERARELKTRLKATIKAHELDGEETDWGAGPDSEETPPKPAKE